MKKVLSTSQFTTLGPSEIWKLYSSVSGIFRGGGNSKSPKLLRADGPRRTDLLIVTDHNSGIEMVQPCSTKGLSFADSIETLSKKKIEGAVWVIPKGSALPEGLVFNVRDVGHPLLNVSRAMSVLDMTTRLCQLAEIMQPCHVNIDKTGRIIESMPGTLAKAAQKW